jgi:hypothetical protein
VRRSFTSININNNNNNLFYIFLNCTTSLSIIRLIYNLYYFIVRLILTIIRFYYVNLLIVIFRPVLPVIIRFCNLITYLATYSLHYLKLSRDYY